MVKDHCCNIRAGTGGSIFPAMLGILILSTAG